MADDCIFCAILAGDSPAEVIDSDEHTLTFMDINPATRGHALVIPRNHSRDLLEISAEDLRHVGDAAHRVAARIKETLAPDGINLLNCCGPAAWQTVFHFHMHVIPRYADDPLELPWIPRGAEPDEIAAAAKAIRGDR